jgi:hypothetical protein
MPELANRPPRRYWGECVRFQDWRLRKAIAMRPTAVILSSWDHYVGSDDWQVTQTMWRDGLRRTYKRLANAGVYTIVMRGTPKTGIDAPTCLSRRAAKLVSAPPCVYDRAASLHPWAIAAQNAAARGLSIAMIDMNDQICATAKCGVQRGGVVEFTDDNHLTASFSRSMAPVLAQRIRGALR